jgi:predicted O-methyltransferase YrrM
MTLLRLATRALPTSARNLALRWREQAALAGIGPHPADPSRLLVVNPADLASLLRDPATGEEWKAISMELGGLGITDRAGGVNLGDRRALYTLVRALRPARVLEIGTHIGASTAHMAAALRANERSTGVAGRLTTVDLEDVNNPTCRPWITYGSTLSPREMTERLGVTGMVEFVVSPSLRFLESASEYDLIFLDGDHSAATVYRELPSALSRLNFNGTVLLHDFFPDCRALWPGEPVIPGPWLAVRRLQREGVDLQVLPLGELPWPTKRGSSVTSLALVARRS